MATSVLTDLARLESRNAFGLGLYASVNPSVDTTPPASHILAKLEIGSPLFAGRIARRATVDAYLEYLSAKNFGSGDFVTYFVPKNRRAISYNLGILCDHLNGLSLESVGKTNKYDTVITVSSPTFPEPITLRLHNESLQQKAIDTSVVYADPTMGKIATTLGYKKAHIGKTLSLGMYGWLYGTGEHVNATSEGLLEEIGVQVVPDAKKRFFVYRSSRGGKGYHFRN